MHVSDVMSATVRTARPDDKLSAIAAIMWEADCGCVPIVDEHQKPLAMVTDRDVCMAALTTGRPLSQIDARTAMSRAVYTVEEHEPIEKAEEIMRARQVRRLPVLDRSGKLIGLLSFGDLARRAEVRARKPEDGLSANTIAWTLNGVSQPWATVRPQAQRPSAKV